MNKKILIPIILIGILAAGVVLLFAFKEPSPSHKTLYVLWAVHVEGDTQECQIGHPCCQAGFYQERAFELVDVQGLENLQSLSENHIDSFGGHPKMYLSPAGEFFETEIDSQYGNKAFRKYDWLALGHEIGPQPHKIYWSGQQFCWPTREMSKEGIIKKLTTLHQWAEKWYHSGQKVNHGLTYAPGMKLELPIFGKDLAALAEAEKFIDKEAYKLGYRISMEDWDAYVEDNPTLGQRIPYLYQASYDDGTTMYKIGFQGAVRSDCQEGDRRCETPQNAKNWIKHLLAKMKSDSDPAHLYYFAFATHPFNPPPPGNYLQGEEIQGTIQVFEYLDELVKSGVKIKYITPKDFVMLLKEPPTAIPSSYQDSPFGAHGAYSRPFFTDDMTRIPGEMDKRTAEVKEPFKHVEEIGIRWVRLNSDIYWSMVQPTLEHRKNGIFNWTTIDMFYGRVPSDVNIFGTIDARPWGSNDTTFKPDTWYFADEEMERYYIKFVQEAVERYDGDGINDMPGLKSPIKYWQVSNEPALRPLVERWEDVKTVRENLKKNLDPQGFSRLLEITYKAIKEKNPEAKIALAGMAGGYGFVSKDPLTFREVHEFYLPILKNFSGKYIDIFDIHYYGDKGEYDKYQGMKLAYDFFRRELDQNGYQNTEIWFTETAVPSKPFGERFQAINLVKRYIYSLSCGAKKIFWWNMIEGEGPLLEEDKPSNHFGLVYDGIGKDDPGYGVKKLSYYTYKKMFEVLEGSDWNNIQTIQKTRGIYIYKFNKNGKSIWVAWNDNAGSQGITISGISSPQVKITEAVPKYNSGKDVIDYSFAFNTETKSVSDSKVNLILAESPVFIEENEG